jgi:hypothetical protein
MTARAPAAGTISPGRRRRPPERDTPVTVQLPKGSRGADPTAGRAECPERAARDPGGAARPRRTGSWRGRRAEPPGRGIPSLVKSRPNADRHSQAARSGGSLSFYLSGTRARVGDANVSRAEQSGVVTAGAAGRFRVLDFSALDDAAEPSGSRFLRAMGCRASRPTRPRRSTESSRWDRRRATRLQVRRGRLRSAHRGHGCNDGRAHIAPPLEVSGHPCPCIAWQGCPCARVQAHRPGQFF